MITIDKTEIEVLIKLFSEFEKGELTMQELAILEKLINYTEL